MSEKRMCALCKRVMGNSLNKFVCHNGVGFSAHFHCVKKVGCLNCVNMILQKVEGQCFCGKVR